MPRLIARRSSWLITGGDYIDVTDNFAIHVPDTNVREMIREVIAD